MVETDRIDRLLQRRVGAPPYERYRYCFLYQVGG